MEARLILMYLMLNQRSPISSKEDEARQVLDEWNKKYEAVLNKVQLALWDYNTNITEANLAKTIAARRELAEVKRNAREQLTKFEWRSFKGYDLKRRFEQSSKLGTAALPRRKFVKLNRIVATLTKIFSTAAVCDYNDRHKCELSLEPELAQIFANSTNPQELEYLWVQFRNAIGPKCRDLYEDYVSLSNEAARLNNYTNTAEEWLLSYGNSTKEDVEKLWKQVRPLYLQLHAYVRTNLRKKYGDVVPEKGPIPAHLLGHVTAQNWANLFTFMAPYPEKSPEDLTKELKKQNYTHLKIFKMAEDFFTSINLTAMPETFWTRSLFEKPEDRKVVCHPSSWDFSDGKDFRIKMCTRISLEHFLAVHHEMGHIEYSLQYKDLPVTYRSGANSGFHEAIGDLIALSVQSSKHLSKIGLAKDGGDDRKSTINSLFKMALDKIAYLPFAYLVDLWRWDVFNGTIPYEEYNCKWWELREEYQGLEPPVVRTESDFDPAAKFHVVGNIPYLRYFVSGIIQFQFHRALCRIAGEFDPDDPSKPLHRCDIYQNADAGNALKKMLEMGSSRPWPDAIEALTGQRTMDGSAIMEYFRPLHEWLEEENAKNGAFVGWEKSAKRCVRYSK